MTKHIASKSDLIFIYFGHWKQNAVAGSHSIGTSRNIAWTFSPRFVAVRLRGTVIDANLKGICKGSSRRERSCITNPETGLSCIHSANNNKVLDRYFDNERSTMQFNCDSFLDELNLLLYYRTLSWKFWPDPITNCEEILDKKGCIGTRWHSDDTLTNQLCYSRYSSVDPRSSVHLTHLDVHKHVPTKLAIVS